MGKITKNKLEDTQISVVAEKLLVGLSDQLAIDRNGNGDLQTYLDEPFLMAALALRKPVKQFLKLSNLKSPLDGPLHTPCDVNPIIFRKCLKELLTLSYKALIGLEMNRYPQESQPIPYQEEIQKEIKREEILGLVEEGKKVEKEPLLVPSTTILAWADKDRYYLFPNHKSNSVTGERVSLISSEEYLEALRKLVDTLYEFWNTEEDLIIGETDGDKKQKVIQCSLYNISLLLRDYDPKKKSRRGERALISDYPILYIDRFIIDLLKKISKEFSFRFSTWVHVNYNSVQKRDDNEDSIKEYVTDQINHYWDWARDLGVTFSTTFEVTFHEENVKMD